MVFLPDLFAVLVARFQHHPVTKVRAALAGAEVFDQIVNPIHQLARGKPCQVKTLIVAERLIGDRGIKRSLDKTFVPGPRMMSDGVDPVAVAAICITGMFGPEDENGARIVGIAIISGRGGRVLTFLVVANLEFERAQTPNEQFCLFAIRQCVCEKHVISRHQRLPRHPVSQRLCRMTSR